MFASMRRLRNVSMLRRAAARSITSSLSEGLPRIDVAAWYAHGSPEEKKEEIADELVAALGTHGYAVLRGTPMLSDPLHGMLKRKTLNFAKAIFNSDEKTKKELTHEMSEEPETRRGYGHGRVDAPWAHQMQDGEEMFQEAFVIGIEVSKQSLGQALGIQISMDFVTPSQPHCLLKQDDKVPVSYNKWPAELAAEDFRDIEHVMTAFYAASLKTSQDVHKTLASSPTLIL